MTETLNLKGAVPTLDERFGPNFAFRTGGANPDPISPLVIGTPLDQGFNPWSQQPVGDKPKAATRSTTYPAFTDMGGKTADVAPNADLCARLGVNPITVYRAKTASGSGSVSMRPLKLTADQKKLVPTTIAGTKEYLSPAINTYPYAQKYGVFEVGCKLPKDRGLFPAFWLMPADLSRYPEIDAMEFLGHDPFRLYQTVHAPELPGGKITNTYVSKTDLTLGYHTHTVDWGPKRVKFYLDRALICDFPTPSTMHKPYFAILNVAIGNKGTWPGPVDPNDHWLSEMLVTTIRAWQRPEYA